MPRSDFNSETYLEELTKGLPAEKAEAVRAKFSEVLGDEAVAGRFADSVLRNQDYGRLTAEVKKSKEETDAFYAQLLEVDKQNRKILADERERAEALQSQLNRYKEEFGDPSGAPSIDTSKFVTKQELEEQALKVQRGWIDFAADVARITSEHFREFGETIDPKVLIAEATKQGRDLQSVYDATVRDRRTAAEQSKIEAKVKEAYEKGQKDAAAKVTLPKMPTLSEAHPLELRKQLGDRIKIPSWERGMEDLAAGRFDKEAAVPR